VVASILQRHSRTILGPRSKRRLAEELVIVSSYAALSAPSLPQPHPLGVLVVLKLLENDPLLAEQTLQPPSC
jgi:hypothetical protein